MAAGGQDGTRVAAVDLGATSVRVAVVDLAADAPTVDVVHRRSHGPVEHADGSLRWDWHGIVEAVEGGLAAALDAGPLASIGVDGWAVDHGLLDADGRLLTPPFSYRDERTTTTWEAVADRIGRDELYRRTGIQHLPFNTIFQLAATDDELLAATDRIVLLPDLVVHHLTGHVGAEFSNASTTALVDHATRDWDDELLAAVGVRRDQLPTIEPAGTRAGEWRGVPVHTVGSHDTASAFLGVPGRPGPGSVTVASGTWVLVGTERPAADVSAAAADGNWSNEGGAAGGVRFLRNVTGFWVFERCREAWGDPPVEDLLEEAGEHGGDVPVVDLSDDVYLGADGIEARFRVDAGLTQDAPRGLVVRSVVASIARTTADTIAALADVTGIDPDEILHVGGATRMELFNDELAARTGLPVHVGSPEAAALGNAILQGVALGVFDDLAAGRRWLESSRRVTRGAAA